MLSSVSRCPSLHGREIIGLNPLRVLSREVKLTISEVQVSDCVNDNFLGSALHHELATLHPYTPGNRVQDEGAQVKVEQGSEGWHRARAKRLTASSVARATGLLPSALKKYVLPDQRQLTSHQPKSFRFGKDDVIPQRTELWKTLLKLEEAFKGNEATKWGNSHENVAMDMFCDFLQGSKVQVHTCAFDVLRQADNSGRSMSWIGASPDGVLLPISEGDDGNSTSINKLPHEHLCTARGIVEIKCPYKWRYSQPNLKWNEYYLPQVATNMEVFNAQYAYMLIWTTKGANVFYVERHQAFWNALLEALEEFWYKHYLPAREIMRNYSHVDKLKMLRMVHELRPGAQALNHEDLKLQSRDMHESVRLVGSLRRA